MHLRFLLVPHRWSHASSLVAGLMLCAAVQAHALPLVVVTPSVDPGLPGVPYADTLVADLGSPAYAWTLAAGSLPSGLTLGAADGVISGIPTLTGASSFIALVTDALGDTASRAFTLTIVGVPSPVTNLAVSRTASGNDADGTIKLAITFTPTAFAATAEVYRAPFGGYPRYDDAGGLTPPTPSYPPGSPWSLTPVTASGQTDAPVTRDAFSYVVFLKNVFGQVSAVSNKTAPAASYALGDVSNGLVPGTGDNLVNDLDISLLGANYGISGSAITTAGVSYLDVGPTVDFGMGSRPFTDARIDFEDLIVFATNYGQVSAPASLVANASAAARSARGLESFSLQAPRSVAAGSVFEVSVSGETFGRIQGLSLGLLWDTDVVEPIGMVSAGWLEGQRGVLWSAKPGQFDAALLGSRSSGLTGQGALATFTFRAKRAGEPALRIGRLIARDAANRALGSDVLASAGDRFTSPVTALLAPSPNPSPGSSRLSFAMARAGAADLAIYSVDGRRIRVIAKGTFEAGTHGFTWDGRDDARQRVAPGVYFARLVTTGQTHSKMLVQLQ